MNFYAAVTVIALSTAAGLFLGDRAYVFCRWWRRLAAAERAERQQPDAGLRLLGARRAPRPHRKRRKSFAEHADEALDVFATEDEEAEDELIAAGVEFQKANPEELWDIFNREGTP